MGIGAIGISAAILGALYIAFKLGQFLQEARDDVKIEGLNEELVNAKLDLARARRDRHEGD